MRHAVLLLVVATTACGARSVVRGPSTSAPVVTAPRSAFGADVAPGTWVLEPFDAAPDWLATQPQLADGPWIEAMADALQRALARRAQAAAAVDHDLADDEIAEMYTLGLRYLCDGQLVRLDVTPGGQAVLDVTFDLRKVIAGEPITTYGGPRSAARRVDGAAVDEVTLRALLDDVADQIADDIVAVVPAHVLATQG